MTCSSVLRVASFVTREMGILIRKDGKVELSGIEGKLLKLILETLNLKLKLVIAEDGDWGRLLENGSWTGMIGKIQQNESDIAINYVSLTEPRTAVVDYSPVYWTDDLTFAIEKQGFSSTSTALIRPFVWSVWATILFTWIFLPLLLRILLSTRETYPHVLLNILGTMMKRPFRYKDNSFAREILVTAWLIYTMIITFSYSSVLLSILAVPSLIPTVRNFEELSEAVISKNYKAFSYKGTFQFDYFLKHEKKYLRMLAETANRNEWDISAYPILFTPQLNKQSAIVTIKSLLQVVSGPEEWKWNFLSDDSFLSYKFAIAMKKGFCHKKRLNTLISRINSAGLYPKLKNDEEFLSWLPHPERRRIITNPVHVLSLTDLIGTFASYLVGMTVSFLVLVAEIACSRFFNSLC